MLLIQNILCILTYIIYRYNLIQHYIKLYKLFKQIMFSMSPYVNDPAYIVQQSVASLEASTHPHTHPHASGVMHDAAHASCSVRGACVT